MPPFKSIPLLLLFLIVILGGLLRFYRLPELTTFRSDQAIELGSTADILKGDFTLIGIKTSNSEIRNGAVMYYLLAPVLYIFDYDPIAGGVLQAVLSLGTVILGYLIVKQFLSERFALFIAFILAVIPQLVLFSRQTLLAYYPLFFSALLFYLAIRAVKAPSVIKLFLIGALAGFSLQIHYSMLVWVGVALTMPLIIKGAKLKNLLTMIIGLILGLAPMIAFELRNEFFNTKMFQQYIFTSRATNGSFNIFLYLVESLGVYLPLGSLLAFFAIVGVFFKKNVSVLEKVAIPVIIWQLLFVIFLVRDNPPHYLLPALVPIIVLFVSFLAKIKVSSLVLVLLASAVFFWAIPRYGLAAISGWTMTEGWSLVGVKKAANIIAQDVDTPNFNVAMMVDAENQALPIKYFLNRQGIEAMDIGEYPVAQTLYVVAPSDLDLRNVQTWEVTSFGPFKVQSTWPIQNQFVLYRLEHLLQ